MPESSPGAGDNIDLLLESCDFIAEEGNPIGYRRFRQAVPQVTNSIAGGSLLTYNLFEPKYSFEFALYLEPNDWATLHSMIEEQHKRIRERVTSVVGIRLLDRRQYDLYRLPRTRARDGVPLTDLEIPGLIVPDGSEVSYSWFEILFQYDSQYYEYFLKLGRSTDTNGLIQVNLTAKELDLVGTSEDTALFPS